MSIPQPPQDRKARDRKDRRTRKDGAELPDVDGPNEVDEIPQVGLPAEDVELDTRPYSG
jgi:hypothetical protein